jgi:hypothetical protein
VETLDLSGSTPRSDNRFKSLFWPSIQSATDVDYLGTQGYWVCAAVATLSLVMLAYRDQPVAGLMVFLLFFLGGVGVRERSRYAAVIVLVCYAIDALLSGLGIVRAILLALLLSNLRATWIAAHWKPESEEAVLPPRFNETLGDKLADQLPAWLWPKVRIPYYIFSIGYLLLVSFGLIVMVYRSARALP